MGFDVQKVRNECVTWIREWFEENGKGCNAVLGISGGKDSSVVAALCVEALGKERVIGVLMPNGEQSDIDCSKQLVAHLGIPYYICNIKKSVDGALEALKESGVEISRQTIVNLPPRIRMATLYALSQSKNGRVANTCNLSEDWVGYSTRYGDAAGDFAPIAQLTVKEVKELGKALGLPINLVDKVPSDGLSGKTDEDNLGFTYAALDEYLRTGVCEDEAVKAKIDRLHKLNEFKLKPMPFYPYNPNA
jgi:NAD+ synthase